MNLWQMSLLLSLSLAITSCKDGGTDSTDASTQPAVEDTGGTSGGTSSGSTGSSTGGSSTTGGTSGGTTTGGTSSSCSPIGSCAGSQTAFKAYSYSDRAYPDDNVWNTDISQAEVDPNSQAYINNMGASGTLHADFGTVWAGEKLGIPVNVVHGNQAKVPMTFTYADYSDKGPYPIPADALIQHAQDSTGDRHLVVVDVDNGLAYEVYRAFPDGRGGWTGDSGAIFDLKTNKQRPDNWTSADAAGLPIFPALVRYDEVVGQGEIRHALRVTANKTRKAYVFPATHQASTITDANVIPMGARLRLKASYDISKFSAHVQVILKAMKKYGMFVADNGVSWQVTGDYNLNWNDQELSALRQVPGSAFEVIKMPPLKYTPW